MLGLQIWFHRINEDWEITNATSVNKHRSEIAEGSEKIEVRDNDFKNILDILSFVNFSYLLYCYSCPPPPTLGNNNWQDY